MNAKHWKVIKLTLGLIACAALFLMLIHTFVQAIVAESLVVERGVSASEVMSRQSDTKHEAGYRKLKEGK